MGAPPGSPLLLLLPEQKRKQSRPGVLLLALPLRQPVEPAQLCSKNCLRCRCCWRPAEGAARVVARERGLLPSFLRRCAATVGSWGPQSAGHMVDRRAGSGTGSGKDAKMGLSGT